jgi:hypothetical protein
LAQESEAPPLCGALILSASNGLKEDSDGNRCNRRPRYPDIRHYALLRDTTSMHAYVVIGMALPRLERFAHYLDWHDPKHPEVSRIVPLVRQAAVMLVVDILQSDC